MKIIITIFLILTSAILKTQAQPNGGFENWNTIFNYQAPVSWQTLNFLSSFSPPNPISAFKATGIDKHSGNYALQLKTIYINNNPAPDDIDDTVGIIFTGKVALNPPSFKYGFPYTGRPEKLEFWSKYIPVGEDLGGAIVFLQKWNGTDRDTIANGEISISATVAYTLFQIDLTYLTAGIPDTAAIIFGSSKKAGDARVGSTLYVDDVAFTGWVGIDEQGTDNDKIKIFPNPASDAVNIFAQMEDANYVQLMDVSGKLLGKYEIKNYKAKINTVSFAEGIYFYQLVDKKEKILGKGKFNIIK